MGLSNIAAVEGAKNNVTSNLICTEGITRMTKDIVPKKFHNLLKPEYAANAVLVLCHEKCPTTGQMYQTEGGNIRKFRIEVSNSMVFDPEGEEALDHVLHHFVETEDFSTCSYPAEKRNTLPKDSIYHKSKL